MAKGLARTLLGVNIAAAGQSTPGKEALTNVVAEMPSIEEKSPKTHKNDYFICDGAMACRTG